MRRVAGYQRKPPRIAKQAAGVGRPALASKIVKFTRTEFFCRSDLFSQIC
jgi:hypothetical protein